MVDWPGHTWDRATMRQLGKHLERRHLGRNIQYIFGAKVINSWIVTGLIPGSDHQICRHLRTDQYWSFIQSNECITSSYPRSKLSSRNACYETTSNGSQNSLPSTWTFHPRWRWSRKLLPGIHPWSHFFNSLDLYGNKFPATTSQNRSRSYPRRRQSRRNAPRNPRTLRHTIQFR